ncbi:MAG: DUF5320 domain-containing protein [Candidatus Aenigmarchaeota archaeon]|nr:DUF5320 domain-containing protein [Candidatus Aenigmarchaeota archaeon]
MPRGDGTGPFGRGRLTGRGLGPCGGGLASRRGFGRGFAGRQAVAEPVALSKEEEKKILEAELMEIETEKQGIEKRLKEMKK